MGHQAIEIKTKINKWALIKLTSLHNKETINGNEKLVYGMGESICSQCNQQGFNFQKMQKVHLSKRCKQLIIQQQHKTKNPTKNRPKT